MKFDCRAEYFLTNLLSNATGAITQYIMKWTPDKGNKISISIEFNEDMARQYLDMLRERKFPAIVAVNDSAQDE